MQSEEHQGEMVNRSDEALQQSSIKSLSVVHKKSALKRAYVFHSQKRNLQNWNFTFLCTTGYGCFTGLGKAHTHSAH